MTVNLTDKERQTRGLDALGTAVRSLVDERMSRAAHGKPWLPRAHSMRPEDALRETARLFGITRLGANVRDRLEGVVRGAISEYLLVERGGYLVAE